MTIELKKLFLLFFVLYYSQNIYATLQQKDGSYDNAIEAAADLKSDFHFTENRGQLISSVKYHCKLHIGDIFFKDNQFSFDLFSVEQLDRAHEFRHNHSEDSSSSFILNKHIYNMNFLGANSDNLIIASEEMLFKKNYFRGNNPDYWASDVTSYKALTYKNLYDGIDVNIYSKDNHLKYDYVVSNDANPEDIIVEYDGVTDLRLIDGSLEVILSNGVVRELTPFAYQVFNGKQVEVACNFLINDNRVSFVFPDGYDSSKELIIDPTLVFATLTGSSSDNWGFTATYDNNGNFYAGSIVLGDSWYSANYPTTAGSYQTSFNAYCDVAISKFNSDGTALLYSTYLGGSEMEEPHSLICDAQNNLVIMGATSSTDFPITSGAYQNSFGGGLYIPYLDGLEWGNGSDIFVTKLNAFGNALIGSTFLGGSSNDGLALDASLNYNYADHARGEVFLDNNNNIYIASSTQSSNFPTTGSAHSQSLSGNIDGVVSKLSSNLDVLIWSTYIGGSSSDAAYSIRVDTVNNQTVICGGTVSSDIGATSGAINQINPGGIDGYVATFNNSTGSLNALTYLGTSSYDQAYIVEIDEDSDIYVTGQTNGSYPVSPGVYSNSGANQFIHKMNSDLSITDFSTVFGSVNSSTINISLTAFMVDNCDNIYVAGWGGGGNNIGNTYNMPITANAIQSNTDGSDFYVIVFDRDAQNLLYGTYFGGTGGYGEHVDGGTSRFDKQGIIYQAVCAGCSGGSFPTTPGVYSTTNGSSNCNYGGFKIDFEPMIIFTSAAATPNSSGCYPLTVNFQSNSTGVSYFWDFDDGTNSTDVNPVHVFNNIGTYDVMLVASDPASCNEHDTVMLIIEVIDNLSNTTTSNINISCNAANDGTATANVIGGTPPYLYLWNDPLAQTTATATGLSPATYTCVVTDFSSCIFSDIITITEPSVLTATSSYSNVSVFGANDGTATVNPNGGTPGYTYLWSDGQTTQMASGLSPGIYTCVITDANGCPPITVSVTITQPPPLVNPIISNAFISQPILCNGGFATDEMQVEISQTTPLTEYSLVIGSYNPAGTFFISYLSTNQTTASILNFPGFLPNVDYFVRLVDSTDYYMSHPFGGGFDMTTGIIDETGPINFPEPAELVATTTVISNNNCVGECIAVEDLNITGGTEPYSITLDGGPPITLPTGVSNYTFTSLCAGLYDIVVTDANGCTGNVVFTVNDPTPITVSSSATAVSCSGFSDGTATVLPTGGASLYTYLWDDPSAQTTATATGLFSGTYVCIVTDAVGCTVPETVFISEPTAPITVSSSTTAVSCSGFSDGTATVLPTGGTSSYTYLWDDPSAQTTATATGLFSGTYVCNVTDAVGCTVPETVIVSEPPLLNVSITTVDVSCSGGSDGIATLNISGGTPNYTINAYGSSLPWFTNIFISPPGPAGVYPFSITDANGCSFSDNITINEPPPVDTAVVDTACGEYLFGSNLINTSGTYSNTLTSVNGCDSIVNLQLTIFEDSSVTYITECDSAEWNGVMYYNDTTVTVTGFVTTNSFGGATATSSGKEGNIWYFGENAGIDFNSSSAVAITDGQLNTGEGCATICDNNGDLLFYTDGKTVYDQSHLPMPNGNNDLDGHSSSSQSSIIVKKPGNNTIYYVFTVDQMGGELKYSEVDMSLSAGNGDVNSNKNIPILNSSCEKIAAIQHQNGTDYWIIAHEYGSDNFYSYLLSSAGLSTGIAFPSGSVVNGTYDAIGYLRASPDGSLLAAARYAQNVELFNFDNSTGQVTFEMEIISYTSTNQTFYGLEFSPDGNLLYISNIDYPSADLYQFNLAAGTHPDIINSKTVIGTMPSKGGALQLAPDGKIYNAQAEYTSSGYIGTDYLGVISNPNVVGISCNYTANSFYLAGKKSLHGLPTFYSSIFNSPPSGCDSVATAIIDIKNSSSTYNQITQCNSFTWAENGQTYFTSQIVTINSTNLDGCLHVDSLDLIINYDNTGTSTVDTCDTYDWNGETITVSGIYNQTFTNVAGCDSVHSLDATIRYSNTGTSIINTCDTYDWNGQTITTSGSYDQTFTNVAGCDSVHTLVATINSSNTGTSTVDTCDTYDWDGVTYISTGTYSNTYTNVSGCDSVHTLNLTINYANTGTSTVDTCDTYDWNGETITVSGIYNQTFTNVAGCDSVHTLDATIRYSNTGTSAITVCDYYDWDGNIYTSSGLYSITYTNVSGCDSVHTLDLTINNSNTGTSAITACDYYIWNGYMITSSGNYNQIFTNLSGCDSTHTLDATINYSDIVTDNVGSHCDSYTWIDGVTYTSSNNTATYTLVNVYGCDSVILLDLTIYQEIIVNANITDELCVNYADGSIVLNASGGVGAFMYNWTGSSGYSSSDINIYNLAPGTYNLTITDFATSCTKDTFFVINPGFDIQISSVINNVSCYDTADATIDIIPLNLIAPIYTWSDISVSIEDRVNLSPGTYYLQIDDNSCFLQETFVITQPDSLFLIAQQTNSVCVGGSLGEISVDVYGGTQHTSGLTYSYYWSNWVNVPTNSSLSYGTYYLTVIDANNCELRDTFDIAPYTIDLLLVNVDPTCNGFSNGSIDLEVLSGYPNFSYSWSNGSNTQDLYNLSQGSYTCTITDIVGCEVDTTIIISEPQPLTSAPSTNNVNCYGENTGTVSLEISGGTEPYNLDWGNIDTNSLFAGVYFYEITDSNGCLLNDSIIITQEDSLEVSFEIIDAQCFNTPTGLIEVIIGLNSGTPPYYFTWNGPNLFYSEGYAGDDLDSLFAGVYDLTITDAYGCGYYVEVVVNEPTQISQSVTMVPSSYSGFNISCKGYNNGWIEAQTSGGYLPYYYEWNTGYEGFDADSITQLVAGVYSCIITDGLGCWTEEFYTLSEPQDELVISPLVTTDYNGYDVSCFSSNDGAIDLNVVGGTGIYTYNISDNSLISSDSIIEVSSGTYGIIVYDSNGCFDEDSISLNAPDELFLELLVFPDTCSRGVGAVDVLVSGGVLDYDYLWETGQVISNVIDLFVGENQVVINDANSCEIIGSVYIEDLEKPLADFNAMPDHRRYFEQLDDPIVFIDMTECYWQSVVSWEWDFGDGTFGSDSITTHVYNEQGEYNVLLTITTEANCIDTISYNVLIDEYDLFIPNAFTPGTADDINTEFKPYGYGISNFRMNIYTRWGERVFETDDIEIGWDGTHYLNGADCFIGIYVYYIEVENIYGEIFKYENQVRLLR